MKAKNIIKNLSNRIRAISPKAHYREILGLLMVLMAIVFFRSERRELHTIMPYLQQANPVWMTYGIVVALLYVILQAGIYKMCFSAIGLRLGWGSSMVLYLKRNFVGVFLPAGGVSALAYSPSQIRKAGFSNMQVHQASALFGFIGLLTVLLAGLPVIVYAFFISATPEHAIGGLIILSAILLLLLGAAWSIQRKGLVYHWLDRAVPSFTPWMNELFSADVNKKKLTMAILYSMGVELCGILHIYIAMAALGLKVSIGVAAIAYIGAVLMMIISPFLRGLGAVELSMVYVFEQFGYNSVQAISITVLFRVFEFWLPLLAGLFSYAWKGRNLFLRIAPAALTFSLGVVNIISAVTPPIRQRLTALREYIPLSTIHASTLLVLFMGFTLLVTSAFLFRGLRNAWLLALTLALLSLAGHLTKAFDYEEAIFAGLTALVLLLTTSQYRIRSSVKWMQSGIRSSVLSMVAVLIFGVTSFYFLDKKHFGIDFTWDQSILHTLRAFLLVEDSSLSPLTRFGHEFIWVLRILGTFTWGYLLFSLMMPRLHLHESNAPQKDRALFILEQYGRSAVDYFKTYRDKLIFFSDIHDAFIAYRISNGFAIVLEEPVCAEENKVDVLREFDRHCRKMGLKTAFYRVDENSIPWFSYLRKKKLMIGQEAILDISTFTLEGKDKKSLRNGLNSLKKSGYETRMLMAPQNDMLLEELKMVSDQWLDTFEKKELVFSQGMFQVSELKTQDIIALTDQEGHVKAFLNIIPDYAEDECTYDLIRKTPDAPGAAMDALIIKLIEYAKEKNKQFINLGMVPMTGIDRPENTAERVIKIAAARIRRFQNYRGLRDFKDKYATYWENKYLVYENDFDLIQLPTALNNVMKPS